MASTTLSFTSLCATHTQHPLSLPLFRPNSLSYLSSSFQRLGISPLRTSEKPALLSVIAKAADAEAPVKKERDPPSVVLEKMKKKVAELELTMPVKERPQRPMPEEIFAVVMIGSRQYIVFPGRWITTQRLKGANANDKIVLNKVLLVGTKDKTYIGKPVVTNAVVHAVVEEQLLDKKVIVFKYKAKKNYRRNIGHRQPITRIKITGITGFEDFPAATLEPQTATTS